MKTGRPRKAVELHRADGTYRKDRHGDGAPLVVGGRGEIQPPPGMDPEIVKVFATLAAASGSILDTADAPMVEAAATLLHRARVAGEDIAKRGLLVLGRFDQVVENPSVKQERDALAAFRQYAEQLGIGPSARARLAGLGTEGKKVEEDFDELADLRQRRTA